jgi:hypothetical protein
MNSHSSTDCELSQLVMGNYSIANSHSSTDTLTMPALAATRQQTWSAWFFGPGAGMAVRAGFNKLLSWLEKENEHANDVGQTCLLLAAGGNAGLLFVVTETAQFQLARLL